MQQARTSAARWRRRDVAGLALGAAAASLGAPPVLAQDRTLRVGILNDMTGPFADLSGRGSVLAAQMAGEDHLAAGGRLRLEVLSADHQNRPDVGSAIARRWVDLDGVAAVVDVPNSAVALAVNQLLREKDKAFLASSTATSDLTGAQCAPTAVQWTFDTWALANGTARALVRGGGDTWFFLTADFAFGHALERDATEVIQALGGRVLGSARHPINLTDYSVVLQRARQSRAKVVGLANAGTDTINSIRQAREFGLTRGGQQRLAGLLVFLTDVHGLGLEAAQGLLLTEAFYWDFDEQTRAWSQRFAARNGGRMPTMNHAGVYSCLLAWLRAAEAAGAESGTRTVAEMRRAPIEDPLFGPTVIRPDGRAVHRMHLFEVKTPAESRGPWDYYKLVATIPPEEAFRPMEGGGCALVPGGVR